MAFARSTIRNGQLLIATTLALGMLTTVSQAYTQEQQQMCTGDAMRLCGRKFRTSIALPPAWSGSAPR